MSFGFKCICCQRANHGRSCHVSYVPPTHVTHGQQPHHKPNCGPSVRGKPWTCGNGPTSPHWFSGAAGTKDPRLVASTAEMYSLHSRVLEVRSRCPQGWALLRVTEVSVPGLFLSNNPRPSLPCDSITPVCRGPFPCVSESKCPLSHEDIGHIGLDPTLITSP